jgi:hypothetical protein
VFLAYTSKAEAANHAIADAVAPQLIAMVIPESPAALMLQGVQAGEVLYWRELELIKRNYAIQRGGQSGTSS